MNNTVIVLILFLLMSCSARVTTKIVKKEPALSNEDKVFVYGIDEGLALKAIEIGTVKIGDSGLSVNCLYEVGIEKAKTAARKAGGRVFNKIKLPISGFLNIFSNADDIDNIGNALRFFSIGVGSQFVGDVVGNQLLKNEVSGVALQAISGFTAGVIASTGSGVLSGKSPDQLFKGLLLKGIVGGVIVNGIGNGALQSIFKFDFPTDVVIPGTNPNQFYSIDQLIGF